MNFKSELGKRIVFFDGAMGTMLQAKGLKLGETPEALCLTQPETVTQIHREYLEAGADVVTANTFGAYTTRYSELEAVIASALGCAGAAAADCGREAWTALDMGPLGKLMKPLGELTFGECYGIFKRSAMLGEKHGADLIVIETMADINEMRAAVLAAKENTSLPIVCTMTFDGRGRTLTGSDARIVTAVLEGLGADALGINCGFGPATAAKIFQEFARHASVPILVQPNAGLPEVVGDALRYDVSPDEFAGELAKMCTEGALLVGGCCGTTPEYIKAAVRRCRDIKPAPRPERSESIICSYSKLSEPKSYQSTSYLELTEDMDADDAADAALELAADGADILCIFIKELSGRDEGELEEIITSIQGATGTPLAFTVREAEEESAERALRIYNGIAGVISVEDETERLLAAVRKYGAAMLR